MTMMMMDDGERSQDEISKLSNIFSDAVSMVTMEHFSLIHFHTESQKQRPLSYFQADERHPVDDLLLQRCDKYHVPWIKQLVKDSELRQVQDAVKEGVVWLLFREFPDSFCRKLQELSKADNDFKFYHSAITAAATFVYSLYPQHLLFKLGNIQLLQRQVSHLWDQFIVWWNEGLSLYQVCKLLVHEIGKDKYSFITECDIILLLRYYHDQCSEGMVLFPSPLYDCSDVGEVADEEQDGEEEETNTIINDIKEVVNKMGCFQNAKVDDYTRLLIKIFRGVAVTENEASAYINEPSLADALETVYTTDFQNSCWLPYLSKKGLSREDIIFSFECGLRNISKVVIILLQEHLPCVVEPLFLLCDTNSLELSPQVCEVIQIAEIRRIALGSRFISHKHLMWAFYECGYGLRVNLKATINFDDEDHPPYQIYVASVKLAMSYGEKVVQLQHFVFAMLRWILIGDGEEVINMGHDFGVYMEDLDGLKKTKAASEGIIEIEEAGRDDVPYQFMVKNKKRRIETTKPELGPRGGGAMSSDY